ncbi:MAG: phosphate ABC transporter ATP-binding protein [Bacillota bacterium]|jgi:phosphate transport system ATP-binding protein
MTHILEIKDLNVFIDNHMILNKINLVIPRHQIFAIIGPSGCGKTTLLRTINRMVEEEKGIRISGEIFFDVENAVNIPLHTLRTKIGIVFQQPTPFPMSIYDNLAYALKYHGVRNNKSLNGIIEDKLKLCGLYDEVKDNLNMSALKLSGGQQQRLCIARTLCVEPEILLLDEPCSSLDVHNTRLIEDLLVQLKKSYTIVIVTHNLQQAKRVADFTAFLLEGKLKEINRTDLLFGSPKKEETKQYLQGLYG